jgi:nucleoid-associated protein YgaU
MPPAPDSRFAGLPVLAGIAPDGSVRSVVALRLDRPAVPVTGRRRVTEAEPLDLMARRLLGNERLWWRILDVNSARHPFDIAVGDVLALPGAGPATRATRARTF